MPDHRITFFVCDNGDASLIEAHGLTIMTDVNYRRDASDENNNAVPDFAPTIREACDHDALDVFVLTHPDGDHLSGFGEIFHLGDPDNRDDDPDDGPVKLIVKEMWCSPYGANPNYDTDKSKPVLDEIKRRKKLQGTAKGEEDGNRLLILSAAGGAMQSMADGIDYRVLAPTEAEADIPEAAEGEERNSSNPSSLVIQWTVTVGSRESKVILGGDSTVEIWERMNRDYSEDKLGWHILLAPHHCSRHSMGRKYVEDGEERFDWSDGALAALDHPIGDKANVVSSSRKFGSKHPPHPEARERYYKILAKGNEVDADVRERFRVTAGKKGEEAKNVVFKFTSRGPTFGRLAAPAVISNPASTGGGGYGQR